MSVSFASSASLLRRVASPKKALTGVAVAAATTGMLLAAAPAQAATAPQAAPVTAKAAQATSAKAIAKKLIANDTQYAAFEKIVTRESNWDVTAQNSSSGAYGLVQALPGSKMSTHGSDWRTNAETQIKWGIDYMEDRYGSPVGAWDFWKANSWY
ncbi:transglycosylase SLT domain-containing protein [Streptomyces sp. NPDC059578]|uniref:aggregation-promoting factor C-terminal-like domain-containing protein n=1 Tax=unclassified Streptomyces TaxID=2593676 RepID=UPI00364EDA2C